MPRYLIGVQDKEIVSVRRSPSVYQVDYVYPRSVRETTPREKLRSANGRLLQNFYHDPRVGESIEYGGHDWRITDIRHYPTKRNSREKRTVPVISLEYIGPAAVDIIEATP